MPARYGTKKDVREILLTFDDGPNPKTTPTLLDVLAKHDIKAMFFVVGERIATPEGRRIMERAAKEGHHIGNHTYSHKALNTLAPEGIKEELRKTEDIIGACGHECKFFRPPYGAMNATVSKILQEESYMPILWNVDTLDWKLKKDGAWVANGMEQIKAREDGIVLMHDIHPTTVNFVNELVTRIKQIPKVEFVLYA